MGAIVPAILPTSKADLEDKLAQLSGLCDEVQIDIVDGRFAGTASWPFTDDPGEPSRMLAAGEMLPEYESFKFEADLMVLDTESFAGTWVGLGATKLTIHAEAISNLGRFFENIDAIYGHDKTFVPELLSVGIAIGAETDVALIEPYLKHVDYVQFMGIARIGRQGEPFVPSVLRKILTFKHAHPDMPVQVDGAVSLTTAPELLKAGVTRLVVGSALWNAPDLAVELRKFNELTEIHGVFG